MPEFHQSAGLEFPVFVPVGPIPIPGVVARFVREANSDSVPVERPQLLDKAILQFFGPLPREKRENLRPPSEKFRAIAPVTILRVATCYLLWISGIPFIFDSADPQNGRLSGEWWYEAYERFGLCIHNRLLS